MIIEYESVADHLSTIIVEHKKNPNNVPIRYIVLTEDEARSMQFDHNQSTEVYGTFMGVKLVTPLYHRKNKFSEAVAKMGPK